MTTEVEPGVAPSHAGRRPFAGEADFPALLALLTVVEAHDRPGHPLAIDLLRDRYLVGVPDLEREVMVWPGSDDAFVGSAALWTPRIADEAPAAYLSFALDPAARSGDLGEEIVAWGVETARARLGSAAEIEASAWESNAWKAALLGRGGFAPVRRFLKMTRSLTSPLSAPELPPGYAVRPLAGPAEVPAWAELINAAFVDHWDFHPVSVAQREHDLALPGYLPALNLVAVAPDGNLAGFCWCERRRLAGGSVEWHVDLLGTHRAHRRRGLGRALLLTGLATIRDHGGDDAVLEVDADSPTGATRLYRDTGFAVIDTTIDFRRRLG